MRSIYDAVKVAPTIDPQSFGGAGPTSVKGTTVDTKGYNTGMMYMSSPTLPTGIATLVVTLQESADNSTWVTANDNTGTAIGFTFVANSTQTGEAISIARIEGLGLNRKRYLRASATYTASAAGVSATTCATILMGRAYEETVNTAVLNT